MIVTVDEVKTFCQITVTTYDALIAELIPEIEGDYLLLRDTPFFVFDGDTETGSQYITNITDFEGVEKYTYVESGSIREMITEVDEDNGQIKVENAITADNTQIEFVVYPLGSRRTASKMVCYNLNKSNGNGKKSETIGTYSYTNEDLIDGYPSDIVGSIRKYHRAY